MKNRRPDRNARIMGIAGIAAAVFGVIWIIETYSMTRNSPFGGGPSMIMTAGGILFVVIAVLIAVRSFSRDPEEDQTAGDAPMDRDTPEIPPPKKAKWTCPYCGTVNDEDQTFCPGCGAGRKKAGH